MKKNNQNSTLAVLDFLKSDVPSSKAITDKAKKKKKKKQGDMNKDKAGEAAVAPSDPRTNY